MTVNFSHNEPKRFDSGLVILLVMVLVKLLVHLWTNTFASYGIFRDEFYYLACSHRLDLGYVDQPPLSIYILALSRNIFGDSLFALRLVPALAGAATVFVTGLMVRQLGGRAAAMAIACLAVMAAPIYWAMNTVYSMNCLDILIWSVAAYILILVIKENKPKHWISLGIIMGLGLLNKTSMIWFCLGLLVAVLLTRQRKNLATRWPYLTALITLMLFLPYVVWNLLHDFAHVEFIRNAIAWKYNSLSPRDFVTGQLLYMHPVTLIIWLAGLLFLFSNKEGGRLRPLGIIYVTAFLILIINGRSKAEYLSPAYTMLFASGAVQFETWSRRRFLAWLKYAVLVPVVVGGVITAPLALPCLPVETYVSYAQKLGFAPESNEGKQLAELPQFYADMFGWEDLAKTVSDVYDSLPSEDRSATLIFAQNYGEAGALEYYNRKYDLPPAVSGHNNYWIWGLQHADRHFETVIIIGGDIEGHLYYLEEVEQAAVIRCQYCMPYENNQPVFIGRRLKYSFEEIRSSNKHYD